MPSKRETTKVISRPVVDAAKFLSPELIDAQGRNDRELLTHRVKLLLDAKSQLPNESLSEIAKLGDLTACGAGCCCCCDALVLPGNDVMIAGN